MKPRIRIATAVLAALALAGCGGGGKSSSKTTPTIVGGFQVADVIEVHETEFSITPKRIPIERFGYYGFKVTNDGTVPHVLEVEGHGIEKKSGEIAPGETKSFAVFFKRAGKYKLYCPLDDHEAKGMVGTVKVH
jgi:hypothetical protein